MSDRVFSRKLLGNGALVFRLVGAEGAMTFALLKLEEEEAGFLEIIELSGVVRTDAGPYLATDLGRHYRDEQSGWTHMEDCAAFDGAECWYSGSTQPALELAERWQAAGLDEQVIRNALEAVYGAQFGDG